MRKILTTLFLSLATLAPLFAQKSDTTLEQEKKHLRAELKAAVQNDQRKRGAVLMDSLRYLYSEAHKTALLWDERWLAYHWAERHTLLLDELKNYDQGDRFLEEIHNSSVQDGLFESLDQTMLALSDAYPALLQDLGLNPEQQEFLMLHLQYLLRNNSDNEIRMRQAFLEQYPKSEYATFVRAFMELPEPKRYTWAALEMSVLQNTWQAQAERNLRPGRGVLFSLLIHRKRLCYGFHYSYTKQKNRRDIYGGFEVFPKGKWSSYGHFGGSVQWGILDRASMRVGPFANVGVSHFTADNPVDDEGNVIEDLYSDYNFYALQTGAGVFFDLKLKKRALKPNDTRPASYKGLKFRAGYNYSNLGRKNRQLDGNVAFVSVGYQFAFVR